MKKLLCILMTLIILASVFCTASVSAQTKENKYEEIIVPKVIPDYVLEDPLIYSYIYSEEYEHYTDDSTTPEYVLVYIDAPFSADAFCCDVVGDYILNNSNIQQPFHYGYGIYIPETGEVFDLLQVYNYNLSDVDIIFEKFKIASGRIGDVNDDRLLNIKDATLLQKALAGLVPMPDDYSKIGETWKIQYIADYNRDSEIDIKDVTAIQKRIADIVE